MTDHYFPPNLRFWILGLEGGEYNEYSFVARCSDKVNTQKSYKLIQTVVPRDPKEIQQRILEIAEK